jgi:iron complex outermembrane recepter protein
MRAFASCAFAIEVLFQDASAIAAPPWASAAVVAQAPEAEKKDAQPAPEQQPPQQAPQQQPSQQLPQAAPPPGQEAQPQQERQPQEAPGGVTQLPPVKVAPAPAEEPKPKPKPKPRIVRQPEPPLMRTLPARPVQRREARPAPNRETTPAPPPRVPARSARTPRPAPPRRATVPAAQASSEAAASEAETAAAEAATPTEFPAGVPMSPVKGSEIPLDKVPSAVSQVTSEEIERSGSPAIEQAIQQQVPGAIITDVNGNSFQTDIQYRGFTASPIEGTPQGLAVYQNGVRINEVFGDTVNWELIPASAINSIAVVTGNPLYGLNALGGALNIAMKDGFGFHGVESDTRAGSFGRVQQYLQLGRKVDNFAAYAAVEGIWDDGWRFFSPSEVKRAYVDLGVKGTNSEFHINFTGGQSALGVVGPTPVQLLAQDYRSVFTNPQTTNNDLAMVSVNGNVDITNALSLSGVGYLRSFHQKHVDGNISDVKPCNLLENPESGYDPNSLLCLETGGGAVPITNRSGGVVRTGAFYGPNDTIGEIDRTSNDTNSFGGTLQGTSKAPFYGHNNIFIGGASLDHGNVTAKTAAELGSVNTQNLVVTGNGVFIGFPPLELAPVNLKVVTNYYGLYFSDTLDVTERLAVTVGGRYNYEAISLYDQFNFPGSNLTGDHLYTRFNPMAGATYKFSRNLSVYGGYAEANRAPTPAELACSDPAQPCLLQNFLVSDPDLKQVVSKTWQGGLRGHFSPFNYGRLDWSAGVFSTQNFDDIVNVTSPVIVTRGYFQNAGETLRQGVEASARYKVEGFSVYANYAFVEATFQSFLTIPSPNNPFADADGNIFVRPGDRIPSIPLHRLKMGFDYSVTEAWKFGADVALASDVYFHGDESNQNPPVPGYGVVNVRTSYDLVPGVTVYGLINNLFNHKYAAYGTFFETDIETVSGEPPTGLTNPRMITPAQPFSAYGGVRLRYLPVRALE